MKTNRQNKGFTLVEVLVALLIFAVGMLGLAGLQLRAHQSSSYAQTRTIATLKVSGLAERMRSNLAGVTARDYEYEFGVDAPPAPQGGCEVGGAACSSTDRATTDLAEWIQELGTGLPILTDSGAINPATSFIRVCRDSAPETTPGSAIACDNSATTWTVYVDWTDQRNLTNQNAQRYSFTFVP